MYDHALDAFRAVAEEGSFSKAAEKLFITHTAVIKQVSGLEKRLEVKLFNRSTHGVRLTSAGQILYSEALLLMKQSERIIQKVRLAYHTAPKTLRVGTSALYPCHYFMDLWDKLRDQCPQFALKIVPFDNDKKRLSYIGQSLDFFIGASDANPERMGYRFLPLGTYRICAAVPRSHPLSKRKQLSLKDLNGYPLMIMRRGHSPVNDAVRDEVMAHDPDVSIVDIEQSYDISTFNRAVEANCPLISLECWDRVHPDIKSIPLQETYTLPFGIVYSKLAGEPMTEFITTIRLAISAN